MFDYVQKLQLALGDVARRTGLKAAAGLILGIGAAFLVAALWSWLATELGWGAMLASLTVGGGFVLIGLIMFGVASRQKHRMPTTDDLKREVQARVSLAADAATDRARTEAVRIADLAEQRVQGFVRDSAAGIGLTTENIQAARDGARHAAEGASRAANSNAGSMAKLIGAFAIGVALAARLKEGRMSEQQPDDEDGPR